MTTNEYRVVCAHFDEDFHQLHKWPKGDSARAKQSVIDLNHRAEMQPDFYVNCAPYKVQQRETQEWADA